MTPKSWRALIARITLDGLNARLTYADSPWGPLVVVTRRVTDVDTGEPGDVSVAYGLPSRANPLAYLRGLIAGNLAHDVIEFFRLDGVLVFPHP